MVDSRGEVRPSPTERVRPPQQAQVEQKPQAEFKMRPTTFLQVAERSQLAMIAISEEQQKQAKDRLHEDINLRDTDLARSPKAQQIEKLLQQVVEPRVVDLVVNTKPEDLDREMGALKSRLTIGLDRADSAQSVKALMEQLSRNRWPPENRLDAAAGYYVAAVSSEAPVRAIDALNEVAKIKGTNVPDEIRNCLPNLQVARSAQEQARNSIAVDALDDTMRKHGFQLDRDGNYQAKT